MSTDQQDREIPVTMIPAVVSKPFLRQSGTDKVVLTILTVCVTVSVFRYGFWGMVLTLPPSVWLIWPRFYGKGYYHLWDAKLISLWVRVVRDGYLWENVNHPDYQPRHVAWWRRVLNFLIRLPHPYPYRVDRLGVVGLVHHSANKTDTLFITGDGSSILSRSPQEQDRRLQGIADEVQALGGWSGRVTIGTSIMRRPSDHLASAYRVDTSYAPDVFLPEARVLLDSFIRSLPADLTLAERDSAILEEVDRQVAAGILEVEHRKQMRQHLLMNEEARTVAENSSAVPMIIAITLPRSARLAMAARRRNGRPIDQGELLRQDIVRLATFFCQQLSATGIADPRVMSPEEVEDYLAESLFVTTLREYRERALRVRSGEETPDPILPAYHPQVSIRVTNDGVLVIDGTGHALLQMVGSPEGGTITPVLMAQLFLQLVNVSYPGLTSLAEPSKGGLEYSGASFLGRMVEDAVGFFHLRTGAKTRNRQIGLEKREQDVADRKHVVYVTTFQTVSGGTVTDIEDGVEETTRHDRTVNATIERVTAAGPARHMVLAALTGIPD